MMKVYVVSGISSGIGKATAGALLQQGHKVIGLVRRPDSVKDLQSEYPLLDVYLCDLAKLEQIEGILTFLKERNIQQIDGLINNAGIALAAAFVEQDFTDIQQIIQINVLGLMKLTQVLLPLVRTQTGRIINVSSISGYSGTPFLAAYCASKHAVEGFSESLRRELNAYGIKVIIVAPGTVKTAIWSKGLLAAGPADDLKETTGDIDQETKNSKTTVAAHTSVPKDIKIKEDSKKTFDYQESFGLFKKLAQQEEKNGLEVQVVVKDILSALHSLNPPLRFDPIPRKFRNYYLPKIFTKRKMDAIFYKVLKLKNKYNS